MNRFVLFCIFVLAVLLGVPGRAQAITNGQPDGNNHPYVGLVVFDDAPGHPAWRCSASLIAPNVLLTAGHCTSGAVEARVWFAPDLNAAGITDYPFGGTVAIEGTPDTYPGFCIACGNGLPGFDTGDAGVVVLKSSVTTQGLAALPTPGLVDTLAMKSPVDLVGYGVQVQLQVSGPPRDRWVGRTRYFAPSQLIANDQVTSKEFIKLTADPGRGKGGTCFGDSGGPDLQGGTNIILGVNSYVTNANCTGVTYSFRIDQAAVLAWVKGHIS